MDAKELVKELEELCGQYELSANNNVQDIICALSEIIAKAKTAVAPKEGRDAVQSEGQMDGELVETRCDRCSGTGNASMSDGLGSYECRCPNCCGSGKIMVRSAKHPTPPQVEPLALSRACQNCHSMDSRFPKGTACPFCHGTGYV